MSTLKTHNLQSPDAGSVNITLAPNAGMIVAGISTFTGAIDANGDLDVDGHTNLDNVSIAGVTTITGTGTNGQFNVERASGAGLHIQAQSALGVFGTTSNHNLRIIANGNERMMFLTNGNIGINESSPSHKLVVGGDIGIGFNTPNDAGRQLNFNVNRGSAGDTLANINWQWNSKYVAQIRGIAGSDTTNKDDAHLAFFTSSANNLSERLRIDSSGRLLVNTTSTNQNISKIVVKASSPSDNYDNHIYLEGSETSGDAHTGGVLGFGGHDGGGSFRNWANIWGVKENSTDGNTASYMAFHTRPNGGNPTERLRIDSSGRLIVGDTANRRVWGISPHLQVNGTEWDDTSIAIHNFGNNTRRPTLLFTKGKSGTLGNFGTSPAAGDGLGIIGWSAHDTTDAENLACYIQGITEQVATANNQYGAITFTTVNGGTSAYERLRIGSSGQIGLAGANYGTARQTIVSNGSGSAVTWSSNPFLLDMDSLGDIDYDGVFLRYREVTVSGNGLVYLGLCKSTTNCPAGRIGCPVGYIPGVAYNSQFRVDKVGITPWPDGSGHRYEYFAIISDYVSTGKLGIFYLTNSTN